MDLQHSFTAAKSTKFPTKNDIRLLTYGQAKNI